MVEVFTAGVLTISDKGSRGRREDESGKIAARILEEEGYSLLRRKVVPDNRREIADTLMEWAEKDCLSLIVTSGGTGLSPTDVTPQAMKEVIDYEVPGIAETMRAASLKKTPHAMLSRAIAGVRGSCLIINLPGSPQGAVDSLKAILPILPHAVALLAGEEPHAE